MRGLVVVMLVAGCGRIGFASGEGDADASIDAPLPMIVPVQTAKASQAASAMPLHVLMPATGDQHTLMLIAAIDTASQRVQAVYDDGNNNWQRLLDGSDAGLTGRVEIWYAVNAKPATDVLIDMVAGVERSIAAMVIEWDGLAAASPIVGLNVAPAAMSNMPSTGIASIAAPALVIGVTAFNGVPAPAMDPTSSIALPPFTHTNVSGAAAYRVVSGGEQEISWRLGEARYHTAGIVGLRLAP